MIDPKARQRKAVSTQTVGRPKVDPNQSNEQLLLLYIEQCALSTQTKRMYESRGRDLIRWMHAFHPGLHVRDLTKRMAWDYVDYVEANYCGNFRVVPFHTPYKAVCHAEGWEGALLAEDALTTHCSGECPLFKPMKARDRLHAMDAWFAFLAEREVIPLNFWGNIIDEWYKRQPDLPEAGEKKRNPSRQETVRLVNGTAHPMRRAMYALSAKWELRPNELFLLHRFASFGLPLPKGMREPFGFDDAFRKYPYVKGFHEGGEMAYLQKKFWSNGTPAPDKRKGNRWEVVDAELRPIVEQLFSYWELHVARDGDGLPAHAILWIDNNGMSLGVGDLNEMIFEDCERLGLMQEGDRKDALKKWTMHCNRHGAEADRQLEQTSSKRELLPDDWHNHFRGDAVPTARKHYYLPRPEQVQKMWHEHKPYWGFKPTPDTPRLKHGLQDEHATHRAILKAEVEHARALKRRKTRVLCSRVVLAETGETWIVPRRIAPSVAFALRFATPGLEVRVEADKAPHARGRHFTAEALVELYEEALARLEPAAQSDAAAGAERAGAA